MVDKQNFFSQCLSDLIAWAQARGYKITMGETWRPPEMIEIYAREGKGSRNSLHGLRLATDLCLFDSRGAELKEKSDWQPLGDYWKSLSTKGPDGEPWNCTWGGDFPHRVDSNHFSVEHNGVR